MKPRTSQLLTTALLVATVIIVSLNAWLAFRAVEDLAQSEKWVSHAWLVIDSLDELVNTLKDADSSVQSYLLSGNQSQLVPYAQGKSSLAGQLNTLERSVSDNPREVAAVHELRAVIESRLALLDQSISERRIPLHDSLRMKILGSAGLTEMSRARALAQQMHETERGLRAQRVARWRYDDQRARLTVLLASAVDLILLLVMFRYIVSERRLLQRAAETTDHLEKLQSISDARLARLSASELTHELLVRARSVVSADVVIFCTGESGVFTVRAADGLAYSQSLAVPADIAGLLNQAIENSRVVSNLPAPPSLNGEPFQRHTRSMLAAPLPVATSIHGVLIAGRQEARPFILADEEILSVAADRIAMSIDRTNAFAAEHQARQEAEARATEIKILNAELELRVRERTSDLETTNRELESFSYSVSHDLRAPLRSIDGFSHAFEEDYGQNVDEKGRDYLRRIRENVQRMGQLIDSMLQLSRITRVGLVPEPIDLSGMAAAVAAEITAQSNGRRFVFQIEPELRCTGDPQLLRAALENLFGNAAKFTSREPEARIHFGQSGGAYFVRDNGVGFDMRYVDKLFSAFTRLHGEKEFRGSGIGLATVARIVQRHHGRIWGESKLGHGATFWFTLG